MNPEDMLAGILERERTGPGRPVSTPFRGSLLGNCLRQQVALAQGVEPTEPISAETMAVFERGHTVGWYVGTRILDRHPDVLFHIGEPGRELAMEDPSITGHVDQLVAMRDGTWELWEVKSLAPNGLRFLGDRPKAEHVVQAGLYVDMVKRHLGLTVDVLRVVYVVVGANVTVRSFSVDPLAAASRAVRVQEAALAYYNAGRLPPRLIRENPRQEWPCRFCPLLTWCRGE